MTPGGLVGPNELRELLKKHGSPEATLAWADEHDLDLAARLRLTQEMGARIAQQLATPSEPNPMLSKTMSEAMLEREIAPFEIALDRHARRQATKPSVGKKKRRYISQDVPRRRFIEIVDQLAADRPMTEIAANTGFDRHLVAKFRDWRLGRGYDLTRGQNPDTVALVKKDETAS